MPIEVKFNSPGEFVRELEADRHLVDRGIVRLTYESRMMKDLHNYHHILVVGTALVSHTQWLSREPDKLVPLVQDTILRLETYCGDDFNSDHRFPERAKQVMKELEEGIKGLGLEVRAGVFEMPGKE